MKCLILSNYSDSIKELNDLTAPNKQQYADGHGYVFKNINMPYEDTAFVGWLEKLLNELKEYEVVMTIGCDALFMNQSVTIENRVAPEWGAEGIDRRVRLTKENLRWWPINNDIMLWPSGVRSEDVIKRLLRDAEIWIKYPWKWQNHLWNIFCREKMFSAHNFIIEEARFMGSTHQPCLENGTRIPGPSSYQLGDWMLHLLDMSTDMKIQLTKQYLKLVGDGTYFPAKG